MKHLPRTLLLGATVVAGCRTEQILDVAPVAAVELSAPYPAISPGEVHQLRVTLRDAEGDDLGPRGTSWRSLDPGFATVDDSGRVTGVAVGVARLVASSGGEADTITLPVKSSWKRVWAGNRLFCAERISGGTWCWGDTPGDGSTETRYAPVPLVGGLSLDGVSRYYQTACGLAADHIAWCWDDALYVPTEYANGADSTHGPSPRTAGASIPFRTFSPGTYGVCGAGVDGVGYCWGDVQYGIDTVTKYHSVDTPTVVLGGIAWRTLLGLSPGACGLDMAGAAYCFGDAGPTLGQGDAAIVAKTPRAVVGGLHFDSLWVGSSRVCGLTAAGEAWCWGTGVLGNGLPYGDYYAPTEVAGGHHFVKLFGEVGCGLDGAGAVWCWGNSLAPERVEAPLPFIDAASYYLTTCGLTAGGGLYCRGRELAGDGGRGPHDTFVRVTDP